MIHWYLLPHLLQSVRFTRTRYPFEHQICKALLDRGTGILSDRRRRRYLLVVSLGKGKDSR